VSECCSCPGAAVNAAAPLVRPALSTLTGRDRRDHFLARFGVRRYQHIVEPGLYALGTPGADSPVFVTANYTLSFDALRSSLPGVDGYIMVLDTKGINVWCAAGKGTFGTDELVGRIEETSLGNVVKHRRLILPQLGAVGVSSHHVRKRSGFGVEYGPVRARDLPEYLRTRTATPGMRRVRFDLLDRLVLVPVELVNIFLPLLVATFIMFAAFGPIAAGATAASVLAGVVLFPLLLPWLPTPNFCTKGLFLGGVVGIFFALSAARSPVDAAGWKRGLEALAYLLMMPPVTAYFALNFTGSTPFTSKTGVRKEIFRYMPVMAWMLGVGIVLGIIIKFVK